MLNDTYYIHYIEITLIGLIIARQFIYFIGTRRNIKKLRQIFSQDPTIIIKASFPIAAAETLSREQLEKFINNGPKEKGAQLYYADLPADDTLQLDREQDGEPRVEVPLLRSLQPTNSIFGRILSSLNHYLLRNKHNQIDFGIVKDIIEREADNQEGKVYNGIQMPLYWGLLGTILGIVVGLIGLLLEEDTSSTTVMGMVGGEQINRLLLAVAVAMTGSFTGLFLTIRSTLLHKSAIAEMSRNKHLFFHFLQTELLPTLPKSMASTIDKLQYTLEKFNAQFEENLGGFDRNISSVHQNLKVQKDFLDELRNLELNDIVEGNIKVFRELKDSAHLFQEFVQYQKHFNGLFEKVHASSDNFNKTGQDLKSVVQELHYFKEHSQQILSALNQQQEAFQGVVGLINSDVSIVQEWKNKIRKEVENLDAVMQGNVEALAEHTQQHFKKVNKVMEKEFVHMEQMFDQSQHRLQNLDYLKHLEKLEKIQMAVTQPDSSTSNTSNETLERLAWLQTENNKLLAALLEERQRSPFDKMLKRIGYGQKAK